jgi:hypothetical protein
LALQSVVSCPNVTNANNSIFTANLIVPYKNMLFDRTTHRAICSRPEHQLAKELPAQKQTLDFDVKKK